MGSHRPPELCVRGLVLERGYQEGQEDFEVVEAELSEEKYDQGGDAMR